MGTPVTDNKNPGMRRVQRFNVSGGDAGSDSDDTTKVMGYNETAKKVSFATLNNCLVDKRVGAVLKRPGSAITLTEPAIPLGVGEYVTPSTGNLPVNRALLINFAGAGFFANIAGVYSLVSTSTQTSFSTSKPTTFAKLGNIMLIAGGRPAKWMGPGSSGGGVSTIDRVGIVAPAQPIIFGVGAVTAIANGITLASGTSYVYTYYNSKTGLESDWSLPSQPLGPITSSSITITIPATVAFPNYDSFKVYRYLDGGVVPYLVTTLPTSVIATTYVDMMQDGSLTNRIADRFTHTPPPDNVQSCAAFGSSFFAIDGNNPYRIVFSQPYVGQDTDLEYWPTLNYLTLNAPATGLLVVPGRLLVFHARGVSAITGTSVADFAVQPFIPGVGTVFPNSVSTNGALVLFLSEQGWVVVPFQGGTPQVISREIDLDLQPLLSASYNQALYASSCWNPALRQFICMVNTQSSVGALWEVCNSGDVSTANAGWQDQSAVTDVWQDVNNPNTVAANRIFMWGWSPELSTQDGNLWHSYTWPTITDQNTNGAYPLFVFHPQPSSDLSAAQQDSTMLGYWDGTNGNIRECFKHDLATDDGSPITSLMVTERIVPGNNDGGFKIFHELGFQNAYSDPTSDGLATLQYLIDFDDPNLRDYSGSISQIINTATDTKKFTNMLGRHVHLIVTDTSASLTKILLSEFFIHYRERFRRSGR